MTGPVTLPPYTLHTREVSLAVDYYHYLVVSGSPRAVTGFVDRIALVVTRRVAGVTRREVAPFSFQSLYALTGQKGDIPSDP